MSPNHSAEKKVVFVGNLPIHQSEVSIRHQLELTFNVFGSRNITLHLTRDKPYAFIEFEVSRIVFDGNLLTLTDW
jgi:hypothetical protein